MHDVPVAGRGAQLAAQLLDRVLVDDLSGLGVLAGGGLDGRVFVSGGCCVGGRLVVAAEDGHVERVVVIGCGDYGFVLVGAQEARGRGKVCRALVVGLGRLAAR